MKINRFSAVLVVCSAAAAYGIVCKMPTTHPATSTETAPCSACIRASYTACPTSDTCPTVFWAAFDKCVTSTPVSVPCTDYSTAPPAAVDPWGCCTGGTKIGNSTTKATITFETGVGDCW